MENEEVDIPELRVYMLGRFAVFLNNEPIDLTGGIQSKPIQLLVLLWEAGEEGISRNALLRELYGDEDILNPSNSLRATVFRLRKQLAAMGLPKDNYINNEKKIYSWNQKAIKLRLDVLDFKRTSARALESRADDRLEDLLEACGLYKGDFLPPLAGTEWVEIRLVEYQNTYYECLRRACAILNKQGRYKDTLKLCQPASSDYKTEEWVLMTLDCLMHLRRYDEALKVYQTATRELYQEFGLQPSESMLSRYRAISERSYHPLGEINEIKIHLVEEAQKGAYYCSYPSFVDGYHVLGRMAERFGYSAFLMICTVLPQKLGGGLRMPIFRRK